MKRVNAWTRVVHTGRSSIVVESSASSSSLSQQCRLMTICHARSTADTCVRERKVFRNTVLHFRPPIFLIPEHDGLQLPFTFSSSVDQGQWRWSITMSMTVIKREIARRSGVSLISFPTMSPSDTLYKCFRSQVR